VKLRREARGHHFYERGTGFHVLLDEFPVAEDEHDVGPELVSIALTDMCDLACDFCYAPKTNHRLPADFVVDCCKQFASIGTLEVAFGGGEPTLYPGLGELCRRIWSECDIGISVTTHGHRLSEELVRQLEGHISVVRISIDSPEPLYSIIRGRPLGRLLERIEQVRTSFPIGINTVVNSATLPALDGLAKIVSRVSAIDWLLLPEARGNEFTLTGSEWKTLDAWIGKHRFDFSLRVTANSVPNLSGPFPLPAAPENYAHVSADGLLRRCSYGSEGITLKGKSIAEALRELRESEDACRPNAAVLNSRV
jgi:MoaA/NifB/PqqE/SkfB family radical SAM enzyme